MRKLTNEVEYLIAVKPLGSQQITFIVKSNNPSHELSMRGFTEIFSKSNLWLNKVKGLEAQVLDADEEWSNI